MDIISGFKESHEVSLGGLTVNDYLQPARKKKIVAKLTFEEEMQAQFGNGEYGLKIPADRYITDRFSFLQQWQ